MMKVQGIYRDFVLENGSLSVLDENGDEKLLGKAILVSGYVTNIDTQEVMIYVQFKNSGRIVNSNLPRGQITKDGLVKLTNYGADCWKDVSELYADYLRGQIEKTRTSYSHSNVGWASFEEKNIFKLHKAVGLESKYEGGKYDLKPKGTLADWLGVMENEVLGNPMMELAVVAGFVAPLLGLIGRKIHMDSIFINLCGASTTGKTTASKVAVSPWGSPSTHGDGLIKNWFGTDQGILAHIEGNFGIPVVIDDTSLQYSEKNYTQFIYLVSAGMSKSALNPDGTKRSRGEWQTVVFSSSEESLLKNADKKMGIDVRLFEIKAPFWTTSAENAEAIEEGINKNYGHAGIKFVEHLMAQDEDTIFLQWEKTKEYLLNNMNQDTLSKRIVGKLALILLAGQIVRESLGLKIDMEMLTQTLLTILQKSQETRSKDKNSYHYFLSYFVKNKHKFVEKNKDKGKRSREVLGKYIMEENKVREIWVPTKNFDRIIRPGKFDAEQVIKDWKAQELLNHDKGKNTLTRVYESGMYKEPLYAIKVTEMPEAVSKAHGQKVLNKTSVRCEVVSEDGNLEERSVQVHLTPLDNRNDFVEKVMMVEWEQEAAINKKETIYKLAAEGNPITVADINRELCGLSTEEWLEVKEGTEKAATDGNSGENGTIKLELLEPEEITERLEQLEAESNDDQRELEDEDMFEDEENDVADEQVDTEEIEEDEEELSEINEMEVEEQELAGDEDEDEEEQMAS